MVCNGFGDDLQLIFAVIELTSGNVVIESITRADMTAEAFDLVVDIGGAEIGTVARLAAALGVEGATELGGDEGLAWDSAGL